MTTAETPVGLDKLRVLIWPYRGGYAAECIETSTVCKKPTLEQAAQTATELIDGLFSHAARERVPLEKLLHPSHQQVQEAYLRAENFPFTPTQYLSPDVQAIVREIEFRFYQCDIPD